MSKFLTARWEDLVMVNYAVDPASLAPYLPAGTEADLFDNKAWVSLVGFMFRDTRIVNVPIPYFGTFEEVNLRIYVLRREGDRVKRGVVFISEVVPHKTVVWMANRLYKEHYTALPCRHNINRTGNIKAVQYQWKKDRDWNTITVEALAQQEEMSPGSLEEFIFEHYYGYTAVDNRHTEEYRVNHPRWKVNPVLQYTVNCDFEKMYGPGFRWLQDKKPSSVFLAEGSAVSIDWKRKRFQA